MIGASLIRRVFVDPVLPPDVPTPTFNGRQRIVVLVASVVAILVLAAAPEPVSSAHGAQVTIGWILLAAAVALIADSFAKIATYDHPTYIEFSVLVRGVAIMYAGFDSRLVFALAVSRGLGTLRLFVRNQPPPPDGYWAGLFSFASGVVSVATLAALAHWLFDVMPDATGTLWLIALAIGLGGIVFDVLFGLPYFLAGDRDEGGGGGGDAGDGAETLLLELRALLFNVPLMVVGYLGTVADPLLVVALLAPSAMLALMVAPSEELATAQHRLLIDSLTGIANRQRFWEDLEQAMELDRMFAVGLLDVDDFKLLNDEHGHLAGDDALRAVAAALTSAVRSTDLAARYGGEEFGLIMRGVDEAGASEIAERVRIACADALAPWGASVSIGIVVRRPADPRSATLLVDDADQSLYQAKSDGKNRVVLTRR